MLCPISRSDRICKLSKAAGPARSRRTAGSEELDEGRVEFVRRFVSQMPNAFEGNEPHVAEILSQWFGRLKVDSAIAGSPNEKGWIIANRGQGAFQLPEVCGPIFKDMRSVAKPVVLLHGHAI